MEESLNYDSEGCLLCKLIQKCITKECVTPIASMVQEKTNQMFLLFVDCH